MSWGLRSSPDVKTVAVEEWLKGVPLANGSKAKVRNVMHALFNCAMWQEWAERNPIALVRQSAKRLGTPDVFDVDEIKAHRLLRANGEEVKVVQESLRHANSRITPDVSTQGLMPAKRQARNDARRIVTGGRGGASPRAGLLKAT